MKKILMGFSVVAATVAPIATVISCGGEKDKLMKEEVKLTGVEALKVFLLSHNDTIEALSGVTTNGDANLTIDQLKDIKKLKFTEIRSKLGKNDSIIWAIEVLMDAMPKIKEDELQKNDVDVMNLIKNKLKTSDTTLEAIINKLDGKLTAKQVIKATVEDKEYLDASNVKLTSIIKDAPKDAKSSSLQYGTARAMLSIMNTTHSVSDKKGNMSVEDTKAFIAFIK